MVTKTLHRKQRFSNRTPINTEDELWSPERVGSSCSTSVSLQTILLGEAKQVSSLTPLWYLQIITIWLAVAGIRVLLLERHYLCPRYITELMFVGPAVDILSVFRECHDLPKRSKSLSYSNQIYYFYSFQDNFIPPYPSSHLCHCDHQNART